MRTLSPLIPAVAAALLLSACSTGSPFRADRVSGAIAGWDEGAGARVDASVYGEWDPETGDVETYSVGGDTLDADGSFAFTLDTPPERFLVPMTSGGDEGGSPGCDPDATENVNGTGLMDFTVSDESGEIGWIYLASADGEEAVAGDMVANWIYVDRPVEVSGTCHDETYDLSLRKGWSLLVMELQDDDTVEIRTATAADREAMEYRFDANPGVASPSFGRSLF